jgi:fumarate hydratase class I
MNLAEILAKNLESGQTAMRLLTRDGVCRETFAGRSILRVAPRLLRQLSQEAFHDVNFLFRARNLEQWSAVLDDPAASANDRYVAASLLKNAAIAAEGVLPSCQDTGTATVVAFKGESVFTGEDDTAELERGAGDAYAAGGLRFSQMAPLGMCAERNTGTNLPAQIDIYATAGDEYQFLFVAKGSGSSNKTCFWQQTKALLNEASLNHFLRQQVRALGVAACPPYHLALVVGGASPELNLKLLKLATAGALDLLPDIPDGSGRAYRDREWERRLLDIAVQTGLGAQFGGKYLAVDARVIRASRHGGSCPVSLGVSCSAHRNAFGLINSAGVFLEDFDRNPSRFLPKAVAVLGGVGVGGLPRIQLDQPIRDVCRQLAPYPVGTLVLLTGTMIVARDIAHARFHELLKTGRPLPEYLKKHPIYYAGPAETPPGEVIGSFGPTTAQRMDDYLPELMSRGASLITLAKGNRASSVVAACRDYDGFYLGTIGGAAALLAKEHIMYAEVIDYADLGMEAVRRIEVRDLPAFVVVDNRGNDLYARPLITRTA